MRTNEKAETMGMRITEGRKKMVMTQQDLADVLHTDKSTVSLYENDRIDIKSSIILEIAEALDCSAGYLLEGHGTDCIDEEIMRILSKINDTRVKKTALKQIEALAMLME